MRLTRPLAIVIALLTLAPWGYIVFFLSHIMAGFATSATRPPEQFFREFETVLHLQLIAVAFIVALMAFYIVHLFRTDRVPDQEGAVGRRLVLRQSHCHACVLVSLHVAPGRRSEPPTGLKPTGGYVHRKLLQVALVTAATMVAARPAIAQDSVRVDDRIRIWPSADHRYAGRVLASWYPDSLTVLRSDSAWRPSSTRTNTVTLPGLARLDLARGNQWKLGVLGGFVAAIGTGIVVGATQDVDDFSGPGIGVLVTAVTAVFAVPVGALVGSFYPRWHRIR